MYSLDYFLLIKYMSKKTQKRPKFTSVKASTSFKPRRIPGKSKKTANYTEFVGNILDPKKNCNLFLVKYKAPEGGGSKSGATRIVNKYELFENKKKIPISIAKKQITNLEQIYSEQGNILCKGIGQDFIDLAYKESDISILQFSRTRTTKRITKRVITQIPKISKRPFSLCGIICLKNLKDTGKEKNIYLDLICSRPGFGSNLLQIAEKFAKTIGKTRLFLKSVDSPLPFYVYKKYKLLHGSDVINLRGVSTFRHFFNDPNCELVTHGREFNNRKLTSVRHSDRPSKTRKCSNVTMLERVQGDIEDGIAMYKDL